MVTPIKRAAILFGSVLSLVSSSAVSQGVGEGTSIDNNGACNGNAVGSGNTIIINCYADTPGAAEEDEHLIVFTQDGSPTVQTWQLDGWGNTIPFNFFPNTVNPFVSEFSLRFSGETQSFTLNDAFVFDEMRVENGEHAYRMSIRLVYTNGAQVQTHCGGIVRVESSATLIPKFHVNVNPTNGAIGNGACNFIAMPSF